MLPKTPMLATATDWSGPTSSDAQCCRLATICGACPTRSTWNPNPASRSWSWVRKLVSWSSRFGASWMNWLIDEARVADAWTRIASSTHDDREVDDDHGPGLGQPRDQPDEPVDQRQQGEREQPGEEEQQQDVAERVEHAWRRTRARRTRGRSPRGRARRRSATVGVPSGRRTWRQPTRRDLPADDGARRTCAGRARISGSSRPPRPARPRRPGRSGRRRRSRRPRGCRRGSRPCG